MVLSKIFFTECINLNTFQLLSVIHILLHFGTPLVSNTYPNFILPFFRLVVLYTVFIASGFPRESEDISNLKNVVLIKTVLQMLFCKAHSISFRNSTSILCKPQFFHIYFRLTALYTAFIASGFLREAFFHVFFSHLYVRLKQGIPTGLYGTSSTRTLQFVTRGLDLTSYLEIGISLKLQIPAKSICPMITISLRWEFI